MIPDKKKKVSCYFLDWQGLVKAHYQTFSSNSFSLYFLSVGSSTDKQRERGALNIVIYILMALYKFQSWYNQHEPTRQSKRERNIQKNNTMIWQGI